MRVSILTGGGESHYQLNLLSSLLMEGVIVEFIGNNRMENIATSLLKNPNVMFFNLRGEQDINVAVLKKIIRIMYYYVKLIKYSYSTESSVFHIQWENKFLFFDRTILNIFYKVLGKKIVITSHELGKMNTQYSLNDYLSRWILYKIADRIIVHTSLMRRELIKRFKVAENKVSVIPHGLNMWINITSTTREEAKKKFDLIEKNKVILFFGTINKYKGIETLLDALKILIEKDENFVLLMAGPTWKNEKYSNKIIQIIKKMGLEKNIIQNFEFVPDDRIEDYFKAADCIVLPYRKIYQSGVLFLAFRFGLPVIASNIGSLRESIEGINGGFVYSSNDSSDLSNKLVDYFESNMYKNLEIERQRIIKVAENKFSWKKIGHKTIEVYKELIDD